MQTGVVKWFNNAKGYGFILADEDGKDVFAHYSAVEMEGYRTLRAGQCVAFEAVDGPKGLHAVFIKLLDDAPKIGAQEPAPSTASDSAQDSPGTDSKETTNIEPIASESPESIDNVESIDNANTEKEAIKAELAH